MENWIDVYEFNKEAEETMEWLFKLLDEEKIPHKEETKEKWIGHRIPKYEQYIIVSVPKEYKEKVELYLKEYHNPNNIMYEDAEELGTVSNEEQEQLKEIKKGKNAQKALAWIPIGMLLIVIICGIISGMM